MRRPSQSSRRGPVRPASTQVTAFACAASFRLPTGSSESRKGELGSGTVTTIPRTCSVRKRLARDDGRPARPACAGYRSIPALAKAACDCLPFM